MIYLGCSVFSVFLFIVARYAVIAKWRFSLSPESNRALLILPFICWIVLIGSQYNVGTDYVAYYSFFKTGNVELYWFKKEYLFAIIAESIYKYRLNPQVGFFVFAFLQMGGLCVFINKYHFKRYDLFLFVYFYCATVFINQMNTLRQYTAMYVILFAMIYAYKRSFIKYVFCILLAAMFHQSALFLFPFYFLNFLFKKYSLKLFFLYILFTFICLRIGLDFVLIKIVEKTIYSFYLESVFFLEGNKRSVFFLVTKLIYLPFYIRLFLLHLNLSEKERYFIHLGFFCYCIKLISMSSFFLGRFAMYFDLISYIPLYYYMVCLVKKNRYIEKKYRVFELFIFVCACIVPYILKTLVFPSNEYVYQSVLFQ